jgi:hypothetical protein
MSVDQAKPRPAMGVVPTEASVAASRRTLTGRVVSTKMQKTIAVESELIILYDH